MAEMREAFVMWWVGANNPRDEERELPYWKTWQRAWDAAYAAGVASVESDVQRFARESREQTVRENAAIILDDDEKQRERLANHPESETRAR